MVDDALQKLQEVSSINSAWTKFLTGGAAPKTKDMGDEESIKSIKAANQVAKNLETMIQIASEGSAA